MKKVFKIITLIIALQAFAQAQANAPKGEADDINAEKRFKETLSLSWMEKFNDPGTSDWKNKWFLDGDKARVENSRDGMLFAAGPEPNDNASHAVLWTHSSFEGNIKIEWDYTRIDQVASFVNIVYIQATGKEDGPYKKDIAEWAGLRREPYMKYYFDNMNLFHISYAVNTSNDDYVRLRRYPTAPGRPFNQIDIPPDYFNTGLFVPGTTYHFTVIKLDNEIFFEVKNSQVRKLFYWSTAGVGPITEGRVGIRHMCTRVSRYKNITVATISR